MLLNFRIELIFQSKFSKFGKCFLFSSPDIYDILLNPVDFCFLKRIALQFNLNQIFYAHSVLPSSPPPLLHHPLSPFTFARRCFSVPAPPSFCLLPAAFFCSLTIVSFCLILLNEGFLPNISK